MKGSEKMSKQKKHMGRKLLLLFLLFGITTTGSLFFWYYYKYIKPAEKAVTQSTYENFHRVQNSIIYDKNKEVLVNLSNDANSKYVIYSDMPKEITSAFVAVEDRNFWKHRGFDAKGIVRVLYRFVKSKGQEKHGASTITQQLIRNTFLSKEVTMDRKLKEIAYAYCLEKKYSKENIMEFYVNNVYFANQQYGIESAANYYFNKKSKELTLAELVYLVAIPNSPDYYDPVQYPEHTKVRQEKILKDMFRLKMISASDCEKAIQAKISLNVQKKQNRMNDQATYAIYCAVTEIMKQNNFKFQYQFDSLSQYRNYKKKYTKAYQKAKTKLYTGGYRIYTSLDNKEQRKLQQAIDEELGKFQNKKDGVYEFQGAATSIDNKTGKVVAIVGGRSDHQNGVTLNRAFESKRQPGSTIKPLIVYGPALDVGYQTSSTLYEVNVRSYSRYHRGIGTPISLSQALIHSKNGAAVWLSNQVGIKRCLSYLQKMKFGSIVGEDYTLSSSLGGLTIGSNTVEMASAYFCIYHNGVFKQPTCIVKMKDMDGSDIFFPEKGKRIYKETTAKTLISLMKKVITEGTAKKMHWNGGFAAGKTGTTNHSKDGWFCGMTNKHTVAVWVGYDNNKKTVDDLYGGTYPANIWKKYQK